MGLRVWVECCRAVEAAANLVAAVLRAFTKAVYRFVR